MAAPFPHNGDRTQYMARGNLGPWKNPRLVERMVWKPLDGGAERSLVVARRRAGTATLPAPPPPPDGPLLPPPPPLSGEVTRVIAPQMDRRPRAGGRVMRPWTVDWALASSPITRRGPGQGHKVT